MNNHKNTIMSVEECSHFLRRYSFGSLITSDLQISHVPFVFRSDRVVEIHLASNNPQLLSLNKEECLLSILGPHAFISTQYYEAFPAVPTWNYASVSIRGISRMLEHEELVSSLEEMLNFYQPDLLHNDKYLPSDFREQLMKGITGIKIEIEEISGKLKLGQHRSLADQLKVFESLSANSNEDKIYSRFAHQWLSHFRPSVLDKNDQKK
ncbi:FMN-binding negative transcriptional regulator [Erwinia mallotivora]|uniref:FMN-binding negative transcriptional regulator n=1 Tax=Erwinia mallotivora TaxID=69222 RepID=UPI0035EB8DD2